MPSPSTVDAPSIPRAEGGTRLAEAALRGLAKDFPNMLFVIADGKVVHASRRGDQALGIHRGEPSRGLEVFRLVAVAPECLGLGQEMVRRRLRGEEVPAADYALLTRDGRRIEGVLTSEVVEHRGRRELLGIFTDKKPGTPVPGSFVRVEYIDFQDVAEHREFRLRVYGREGSTEFRFGIAIAAFGAGRVSLQDGPGVCYQKLLRAIAAGETASPDVVTIDEVELASYREAHAPVRKHWSSAPLSPPTPSLVPRAPVRRPSPPPIAASPVVSDRAPGLEEGQRVRHAIFGAGVTAASSVGHTVVCFDTGGTKTFVTSMLAVDVLSAPHTWETSRRGVNRPRRVVSPPAESPSEEVAVPAVG